MRYSGIKNCDIANGRGVRVSLFVSGCRNACKGCFNPETWSFNYGKNFTCETWEELKRLLANPNIDGLSVLGGDPFEPENRPMVETICGLARYEFPEKTIWMWTGYLWEDLCKLTIMEYIDVLVDGPFVQELKDLRLPYRGSSNQRVIDVQASLREGTAVLWEKK